MDRTRMAFMFRRGVSVTLLLGWVTFPTGMIWAPQSYAHGGEIEIGGGSKGPVPLSEAQEKAIDLQQATAKFKPLAEYLTVNGELQLLPDRQAEVSTRISGQVTALYAGLGDRVKSGQRLARIQSRLVGDPPPSVEVPAPMNGVIDQRNVSLGQSVEPTTVLFHISDSARLNVVARVYEEDIGKVKPGQEARVHVLSYPDRVFTGKVTLVGPALDPDSRTVEVWVQLANPEGVLKPNMFARTRLLLRQSEATLAIPNAAIIEANGEKFVFVRQGRQFARIEIATGIADEEYTEVTDGLVPGDEVITRGNREIYTLWLTGGQMKAEE